MSTATVVATSPIAAFPCWASPPPLRRSPPSQRASSRRRHRAALATNASRRCSMVAAVERAAFVPSRPVPMSARLMIDRRTALPLARRRVEPACPPKARRIAAAVDGARLRRLVESISKPCSVSCASSISCATASRSSCPRRRAPRGRPIGRPGDGARRDSCRGDGRTPRRTRTSGRLAHLAQQLLERLARKRFCSSGTVHTWSSTLASSRMSLLAITFESAVWRPYADVGTLVRRTVVRAGQARVANLSSETLPLRMSVAHE